MVFMTWFVTANECFYSVTLIWIFSRGFQKGYKG